MKICAMGYDANGRSSVTHVDIPLKKVSDTFAVSEKQSAAYWGIAFNQNSPLDNEYEMHLTNVPRIVGVMTGNAEITMQNGDQCRLAPGEFIFVHGKALHHSTMRSTVPTTTLNVTFHGTEGYEFK